MLEHTPGPWVSFVDRSGDSEIFDILPAMREGTIASGIKNRGDEALILASPDLLAAAVKCFTNAKQDGKNVVITGAGFRSLVLAYRKATGQLGIDE